MLYLRRRRGFMRLALQFGADVIPTYAFGSTSVYRTSSFAQGFRLWLSKTTRIAIVLFAGRWFTGVPLKPPGPGMTMVVGMPYKVPANPSQKMPTDEDVDRHLAAYCDHVVAMYDRHKAAAGYGESTLKIR